MAIKNGEAERKLFELLADRKDEVTNIALATRQSVRASAKKQGHEASELVYCSYCISVAFTFTQKLGQAFIHIATYANHVNLGFNQGVKLDDPSQLLKGSGKAIRHIRIHETTDLKTPAVKLLIDAAVTQGIDMANSKGEIQEPEFLLK